MPEICEGPKRTATGSEPVRLLSSRATVFTEIALFCHLAFLVAGSLVASQQEWFVDMPWVVPRTGYVRRYSRTVWLECCCVVCPDWTKGWFTLRRTTQLKTSLGSRSDILTVGASDKVYETTKLGAVFDMLVNHGVPADDILRDVNIPAADVHSPDARISLTQLIAVCRNALRLSTDRHLPYRIGGSIHISTYGMYGYALLCCPDFRKAMEFAMRCHALAAPLTTIEFQEDKTSARWTIEPNLHALADSALYRFIAEMQIGIHISLMRDIMGPTFTPSEIRLAYPQAPDFDLPLDIVGCPVRFDQSANQIVFEAQWLDRSADLGNKTTYPTIVALCDDLLGDLRLRMGVAGRVRALLLRDIANPPSFEAVAKLLGMNERSLRRQLRQQGFSFRGLRDELRTQIALKYLRSTALANEDIALALGFSDAANFRRAFHRWTNKSPSDIRGDSDRS
ncbi:AraC family transcriptional regulator [Bradyrhizobium genosp. L]|uniref:AraC family transcriptional regulator n=1 Tax=Bradyrhizobium genosp. L TaxID=83637 RepID=UPI001FEE1DF5|nr:AraC family transcriptional regulator [Bradyrhizobium genosp. L]